MKTTYFYITLFSSLILFIGCEKDEDKDSDEPTSISGCMTAEACNYNADATDEDDSCIYVNPSALCDTCSGETDGTGVIIDNDSDNDSVCDIDDVCPGEDDLADINNNNIADCLEIIGCMEEEACNYDAEATFEDESCWYELSNPIEFTDIEDTVYGTTGEDIYAYIDIRNASCNNDMWGLEATRMTQNDVYFETDNEGYFTFCFGPNCFFDTGMPDNFALSLAPGEILSEGDSDNRFKATLFSNITGQFEVTYRFFLNSATTVNQMQTITFIVD